MRSQTYYAKLILSKQTNKQAHNLITTICSRWTTIISIAARHRAPFRWKAVRCRAHFSVISKQSRCFELRSAHNTDAEYVDGTETIAWHFYWRCSALWHTADLRSCNTHANECDVAHFNRQMHFDGRIPRGCALLQCMVLRGTYCSRFDCPNNHASHRYRCRNGGKIHLGHVKQMKSWAISGKSVKMNYYFVVSFVRSAPEQSRSLATHFLFVLLLLQQLLQLPLILFCSRRLFKVVIS